MHHETDVLLIDAHPESGRCDDDVEAGFAGKPFLLRGAAVQGAETGVVGRGTDVVGAEPGSEVRAGGAGGGVDDT